MLPSDLVQARGLYRLICRKPGGKIRWKAAVRNGVTIQGLNHLFDRGFRGITAATWYAGMIASGGFTALSAADTAASHGGWSEYAGVSSRPALSWLSASGGLKASNGSVSLTVTGSGNVRGCFMASNGTVGSGLGVLYSTGELDDDYPVAVSDTIFLTYAARMA